MLCDNRHLAFAPIDSIEEFGVIPNDPVGVPRKAMTFEAKSSTVLASLSYGTTNNSLVSVILHACHMEQAEE
jgi:hypothetical protein